MSLPVREQIAALQAIAVPKEAVSSPREDELIAVSSATRRVAFAYERLRNTLEPDEEHVLRQNAIARIVDRRIDENRSDELTANLILQELIRGHYVPPLSREVIPTVAAVITKTRMLAPSLSESDRLYFLTFVAVTIDRLFFPQHLEDSLVHLMYQDTFPRMIWADEVTKESERPTQLYVACHKVLFASSQSLVLYHFFLRRFSFWQYDRLEDAHVQDFAENFPVFRVEMEQVVSHEIQPRLQRLLMPVSVPYRILWQLLQSQGSAFESEDALVESTKQAIVARIGSIQEKIQRRAFHSVIFLLITKTAFTVPIELGYEVFVLGTIHWLALAINMVFHPILLFFLSVMVRLPGHDNAVRIVEQVHAIVTGGGVLPNIIVSSPRQYGMITRWVFATIYAFLLLGFFYILFLILHRLEFSVVATFFFVVFLGLTSFLAFRIRRSIRDVQLVRNKEGAISTLFTFLTLPMLEFGRWLSTGISQLNVVIFIMDLIIEAPFKLFIDVTEEWFVFIRERKEEIAE